MGRKAKIVRISVSLTAREAEMLDRISVDLYGDRERVQSMAVATLIRDEYRRRFGREATPEGELKKDESGDEQPHS